jgi:lipopolysaccharide export system permease protein
MTRILFITANRIGDAVLSTAVLEHARGQVMAPDIDVVTGPLAAPLFRATPGLDRLITISKEPGRWRKLWGQLRGRRYDLAIDLRGSLTTFGLACARRIIHRKRPAGRHKLKELSEVVGVSHQLAPALHLDARAKEEATALLAGRATLLTLGAGANFIGKRWPPDRFAALAHTLIAEPGALNNAAVVLLGAPDDAAICAEIEAALRAANLDVVNAAGRLDLLACAAVLSRSALFVGNDSGLMHMAACMGAPTLGLFGPSDERVYGPTGPRARSLRGRAYDEIMAIGYMPHITRTLMEDISVEMAVAASRAVLALQDTDSSG